MTVSNTTVEQVYSGDGSTTEFQIPFAFIEGRSSDDVKVFIVTTDDNGFDVDTEKFESTDWDFVYPTPPPPVTEPIAVDFDTAPASDERVRVKRIMPLKQIYDLSVGQFKPEVYEEALDFLLMLIQQIGFVADQALTVAEGNGKIPPFEADALLASNSDGDGFVWISQDDLGVTGELGLPTDGSYGGINGAIAGVAEGDTTEDAFDKVETLLGLLVPAPPDTMANTTIAITGSYSALEAGSGTAHSVVTDDTTPEITPGTASILANSFRNSDTGTLSAEIDATEVGTRALTSGDDTGTYSALEILDEFDPYAGQAGKEGIWEGLTARVIPTSALSVGNHNAQLKHSETGNSNLLDFWVDDPATPTISSEALSATGASSSHKSGVPGIAQGQSINVTFDVDNAVNTHYNDTRIARASSSQTTNVNDALPGAAPANGATVSADIDVTVNSGAYTEDLQVTCTGYNSKGGTGTGTASNSIRIDTVGSEDRVTSSTGQYPTTGYGSAFDSTKSLADASYFELQYLNGLFQDPPAVNYSTKTPAGPDYSSLSYDSHNSMRWATFDLGSISSASSFSFTIDSASNFGGTAVVSGIELYLRVDGGTPTSGWVDANAAYPGVGDPTNDGDAALDVGNSTATSKRVTFGSSVKTGTVYVRIGIPSGSNKTFGGMS